LVFQNRLQMKGCHTLWEERVWKATLSAIQSSLMPRSLAQSLSALSNITAKLVVRYEKASERWEIDLVQGIRRDIKIDNSLSNLIIGSDPGVFTSAASFEKGWDNSTSLYKGSSTAFMPWSTSLQSSEMSIAYWDSACAVVGDWTKRIQRWLTVHAVSGKRMNKVHSRLNNSKS